MMPTVRAYIALINKTIVRFWLRWETRQKLVVVNRGSVVPKLDLQELMRVYRQNQNVSEHIRKKEGSNFNSTENILHSYDLQAGSYIDALNDEKHLQCHHQSRQEFHQWSKERQ